ncbi:MAG TPA: cytochrome c-type biogenesis protein, partial [Acidiferrobacteraceae bacterium]|nr:cytochrome c-type biogenesis protein [Acidiferrobacteraceae bacterium]
ASAAVVHEDPLRAREVAIARQLRCTVCQAESVAESNAGIARDMRKLIRQKLAEGQSNQQIIHYFVARYGDYILLKPRFDRLGAILWVGPVALLLLLGAVAYGFLRRRTGVPGPQYPGLSDEDAARVRAAQKSD